jgi:hypothetical protein
MVPVVAPNGTVAVIVVAVLAVTVAIVPLNFTVLLAGVGSKFVPVIVTTVLTEPEVGVKLVMVGVKSDKGLDQTPAPFVPAKTLLALIEIEEILRFVRPVFTAVHVVPLLVERNTPPDVPAKMLLPLIEIEETL